MNGQDALCSISAFQSSEIVYHCFKMEMRWLSISSSFQVLRSTANLQYVLTSFSSSETTIWTLFWVGFGVKGQDVDPLTA